MGGRRLAARRPEALLPSQWPTLPSVRPFTARPASRRPSARSGCCESRCSPPSQTRTSLRCSAPSWSAARAQTSRTPSSSRSTTRRPSSRAARGRTRTCGSWWRAEASEPRVGREPAQIEIGRDCIPIGSTDNHATSGLKFAVLHEFLSAGCSVLLSDVDVLWMQNPFTLPSLYRDADVEGMTDGWDDVTAYGYEWPSHTRSLRLGARNSGLFYVRATVEAVRMMARLKGRMQREARPPARPHVVPCTFSPPRPTSRPRPPPRLPTPAPRRRRLRRCGTRPRTTRRCGGRRCRGSRRTASPRA